MKKSPHKNLRKRDPFLNDFFQFSQNGREFTIISENAKNEQTLVQLFGQGGPVAGLLYRSLLDMEN